MKKMMMMLIAYTLIFIGCEKDSITGEGPVETENRVVNTFDKVYTAGATRVYITQGDNFSVSVKAYKSLLPYLKTTVENGVLKIAFDETSKVTNDNSEVYITVPALTKISTQGSGDVTTTGDFRDNSTFDVRISGSADVSIEKGSTQDFISRIEGSGNVKAYGMQAEDADVKIYGSGNTELSVTKTLDVRIEGSGNVYYKGSPEVSSTISGSGRVIKN